jgi:hypothetical protein
MTINTTLMSTTAVARKLEGSNKWTVHSPAASFHSTGQDRSAALTKYIEMIGAHMYAQQKQTSLATRGRGRPSKNYDAHLHIQVEKAVKERFDEIATAYDLSQSETIVFLLDSFEILRQEFVQQSEMDEAERRVLQPA